MDNGAKHRAAVQKKYVTSIIFAEKNAFHDAVFPE